MNRVEFSVIHFIPEQCLCLFVWMRVRMLANIASNIVTENVPIRINLGVMRIVTYCQLALISDERSNDILYAFSQFKFKHQTF